MNQMITRRRENLRKSEANFISKPLLQGVTPLVVAKERKFEVKELTQKSVGGWLTAIF